MKRFSVYAVMVMLTLNLMGQNDEYEQYYRYINEYLTKGNCDRAQWLYNVYKAESGRSDKDIEARLDSCRRNNSVLVSNSMTFKVGTEELKMVWVEGGTFTMGCTSEQGNECDKDEKPSHSVTLDGFYICEMEVTDGLFRQFVNQSGYKTDAEKYGWAWIWIWDRESGKWRWDTLYNANWMCDVKGKTRNMLEDNHPVKFVSWNDAQAFCQWLNRQTGRKFRLPTEAEWEYAARGGKMSRGYKFSGSNSVEDVAWYFGNSGSNTHPVKTKMSNELGLYDMSGNVWEWCSDGYGSYSNDIQTNPQGTSAGTKHVCRGGSWGGRSRNCCVSDRDAYGATYRNAYIGFRLVMCP